MSVQVGDENRDGGMFVNLDDDPELEYVAQARDTVYALNPDGSAVAGWPIVDADRNISGVVVGDLAGGAPAWGDVDGDGEEEIVVTTFFFGIRSFLRVIEKDGSLNPAFSFQIGATGRGPSLANLDSDPALEILVNESFSNPTSGDITIYDNNGFFFGNFPIALDDLDQFTPPGAPNPPESPFGATPSVGDIDDDGQPEIVTTSRYGIYAFETDGSLVPGFPFDIRTIEPGTPNGPKREMGSFAAVSLADLDGNGDLELIFPVGIFQDASNIPFPPPLVHVINHDGTPFPGNWPFAVMNPVVDGSIGESTNLNRPVSVADIDLDGSYDIVFGDATLSPNPVNQIYALETDGTIKPGFPINDTPAQNPMMMIANLDADPELEIIGWDNAAAFPNMVYNHDGTQDPAWIFDNILDNPATFDFDGAGTPTIGDYDLDGTLDVMWVTNNLTGNPLTATEFPRFARVTNFWLFSGTNAFNDQSAPVRTYGYNNQRTFEAVPLALIGPVCLVDFNTDGFVNSDDVDDFTAVLGSGDPVTDLNDDGSFDAVDLALFFDLLRFGCD
ncbi:MAG: hypothetical protein AAGI30_00125 [Planctomycetota bacterium]